MYQLALSTTAPSLTFTRPTEHAEALEELAVSKSIAVKLSAMGCIVSRASDPARHDAPVCCVPIVTGMVRHCQKRGGRMRKAATLVVIAAALLLAGCSASGIAEFDREQTAADLIDLPEY